MSPIRQRLYCKLSLWLILLSLEGCASFPPLSVSAGFMGASVTVATPGWTAPVPVVALPVTSPVLLVPPGSSEESATVLPTATTPATTVAVVVSDAVKKPTLAIPK
jgi:ABC-type transport system involved in cytochrome c biogenesis permease component